LDTETALETAGATENAELHGQYRRPEVLLAAACVLGLLMVWTVFHDFRSGYDLRRIGRDLILVAVLAGLLATIYVRQRKA
jgi:bacteriorhodopsin